MTTIGKLFCGAGIALAAVGISSNVEATVLSTSPVWADLGQTTHTCNIVNKSLTNLPTVKVELVSSVGTVLLEQTFANIGQGNSREIHTLSDYQGYATCRFTLPLESVGKVRANIAVFRDVGTYFQIIGFDTAR